MLNTPIQATNSPQVAKLKLKPASWLSGLQLSAWDNIYGPIVKQFWEGSEDVSISNQKWVARYTLSGEISSQTSAEQPFTCFHLLSDLDLIVSTVIFKSQHQGKVSESSLTALAKSQCLPRYLCLHEVMADRLLCLAKKYIAIQNLSTETQIEALDALLPPVINNLDVLFHSVLPALRFSNTYFFSKYHTSLDADFLAKAVTSHLQTFGSTVVVGKSESTVNKLIDSLSIFDDQCSRKRSSYALEGRGYVPDLFLQGILSTNYNIANLRDVVIQSLRPTTVVDLDRSLVWQTPPVHVYALLRRECFNTEIEELMGVTSRGNLWTAQKDLFDTVKEPSPFVYNVIVEGYKLPPETRQSYIRYQQLLLCRRAVALIKYVEGIIKAHGSLSTNAISKVRADLEVHSNLDWYVVLAIAEKHAPGIFLELVGDPLSKEEKFLELYEMW
eukprot:CAMPEP_0177637548 /NCGR_PEP_ID=MMETSP0447-20121125/5028_1 /TAXON_ID=0 /ORGANISM="Stygamoeba regulata, Strain BSH-02190019" /LENGTH=442 /DNA_ID=CAMNT_0019139479 /DNA_START=58 /DNA_END=1383 /DNA_ORIENTATION=+